VIDFTGVYVIPGDVADRPELRPLLKAGIRAGDVLFTKDPSSWSISRNLEGATRPTRGMFAALDKLRPVPSDTVAAAKSRARTRRTVTP
jgi:hypothetical protein